MLRPLLLLMALLVPAASSQPLLPDPPALPQDHCTGAAKATECVATAQKIAACRQYLFGSPPFFITFPRLDTFEACVEKAHP